MKRVQAVLSFLCLPMLAACGSSADHDSSGGVAAGASRLERGNRGDRGGDDRGARDRCEPTRDEHERCLKDEDRDEESACPSTLGDVQTSPLPTGQRISPTATPGSNLYALNPGLADFPEFVAGQPVSEALSPDGKTLLILTTGYNTNVDQLGNTIAADSREYVFVFDVTGCTPVQKQVIQVPNTYLGITFTPDGSKFLVSGGKDDNLHVYAAGSAGWAEAAGSPIALGHNPINFVFQGGIGLAQGPLAVGVAVTSDGTRAIVTNRYNDSISIIDLATSKLLTELDLRPGKSGGVPGTAGGEYPSAVAIVGNGTAYVASERDREIVVVAVAGTKPSIQTRIPVQGNPVRLLLNKAQSTLFVASDNADVVSMIDTATNTVSTTIPTLAPAGLREKAKYKGASPNALALSADETTLYVSNRGTNSLAVVALEQSPPAVSGLIPTGWYPSDVKVAEDGRTLFVVHSKSVPGPNPGNCYGPQSADGKSTCPVKNTPVHFAPNEYIEQLTKGGFLTLPVPNRAHLRLLTRQVARNNHLDGDVNANGAATMAELREHIKHVIYILKENRTYDQVLGDLGKGNGNPLLTEFPGATTPNQHNVANDFVALDNFYDTGEVSGNGWPWSTSARESEAGAKMLLPNYAGRGGSYDWEGENRNVNVGLAGLARIAANPAVGAVLDSDVLPGTGNVAAPDGPDGEVQQGYLWNAALRAGKSVRNYGFFIDGDLYQNLQGTPFAFLQIPRERAPFANHVIQSTATDPALVPNTDSYFRGFDPSYPDFYREIEWEREFDGFVAAGTLPALSLVRLMNDHTGSFGDAIDGVNTPEIQVADNDYAVGRLLEKVAHSPYAADTLIFILEDDAQDGPDHVDAHRSTAYVVGPYVKTGAVVGTRYSTVNMVRTITDVLGLDHLGLFDATVPPMTDAFDLTEADWSFTATGSGLLKNTKLPLPATLQFASGPFKPTHSAKWWAEKTKDMDFTTEDKVDSRAFNKLLWDGLMPGKSLPKGAGEGE